jgi:hypothetical protein
MSFLRIFVNVAEKAKDNKKLFPKKSLELSIAILCISTNLNEKGITLCLKSETRFNVRDDWDRL